MPLDYNLRGWMYISKNGFSYRALVVGLGVLLSACSPQKDLTAEDLEKVDSLLKVIAFEYADLRVIGEACGIEAPQKISDGFIAHTLAYNKATKVDPQTEEDVKMDIELTYLKSRNIQVNYARLAGNSLCDPDKFRESLEWMKELLNDTDKLLNG